MERSPKQQEGIDDNKALNAAILITWAAINIVVTAKLLDWWVF